VPSVPVARESGPVGACFLGDVQMPYDPREHQKARELCLLTLLEKIEADENTGSHGISLLEEMETARLSGLDNDTVDRICQELEADSLIDCPGGKGEYRVIYSLSVAGRIAAEKIRDEKSSLTARRKVTAVAGESAREAAEVGLGKLLAWLGAGAALAGWWN
jgi:hypothetical protein